MSKTVVETIYGKLNKYEVIKDSGTFSTTFYVKSSNGKTSGEFSSLSAAVEWAKKQS